MLRAIALSLLLLVPVLPAEAQTAAKGKRPSCHQACAKQGYNNREMAICLDKCQRGRSQGTPAR